MVSWWHATHKNRGTAEEPEDSHWATDEDPAVGSEGCLFRGYDHDEERVARGNLFRDARVELCGGHEAVCDRAASHAEDPDGQGVFGAGGEGGCAAGSAMGCSHTVAFGLEGELRKSEIRK